MTIEIPRKKDRRRTAPTTAVALGVAGLLGLGVAPVAGAQPAEAPGANADAIEQSVQELVNQLAQPTRAIADSAVNDVVAAADEAARGIIDTPEAQQALAALRGLQGADPNRMATGLIAGGEQFTDFIAGLMASPERLESLAVTVVTDTSKVGVDAEATPASLLLTATDTDGQVSVSQLDDLDPQAAADVAELVTGLAAEITGSVTDGNSVSTAPAPGVGASDLGDGLDALADLGDESGLLDTEDPLTQSVLTEVQSRLDELTESVPVLDEVLTTVDDLAVSVEDILATLRGEGGGNTNTNTNTNTSETTVNISFGAVDGNGNPVGPQASVTTNDGEQLTQTRTDATPLQADALASVLDASVSAQTITEARSLVREIIHAASRGADTGGVEGRLVSLLNAAITTGEESERAALAEENGRLVDLLAEAARAHANGEALPVDGEVITELVVTSGNQLVKTLREAITVEMHKGGIDERTTAAVTGVTGAPGEVIVRVPIPRQGAGGTGAGTKPVGTESGDKSDTDDLLERISAALAALANLNDGRSKTDDTIAELVDKLAEADTEKELAEILKGLSTKELTALAEVLESVDTDDRNSRDQDRDRDRDRDEATRELIQAVMDQVPEAKTAYASNTGEGDTSNQTARPAGTASRTTAENTSKAAGNSGDEVVEEVVVVEKAPAKEDKKPDEQQQAAPEQLAVTGSDSLGVVGVLGILGALVLVLAGGAVWWQRRSDTM